MASSDSIREVMVDATETAPTFSTNPPRATYEEGKKKAEFRAYLVGENSNIAAWEQLMLSDLHEASLDDLSSMLLSNNAIEYGNYED